MKSVKRAQAQFISDLEVELTQMTDGPSDDEDEESEEIEGLSRGRLPSYGGV